MTQFLPLLHRILGSVSLVFGLVLLPLPIPLGLPLLIVGLALWAPYLPFVQGWVRSLRRKYPNLNAQLLRYREKVPPVIRTTIDKTHP
ncbi:MAG: hypothetical protein AAFV51_13505 [Pseudomonadota bacterium]